MLDERKAAILRAVVEVYIDTAQPVGSAHVARMAAVEVSSATVRNEMATLEREGFLAQPHTSAGRVPTDKGYRFFVDSLEGPARLEAAQSQQVKEFFAKAHGEVEHILAETSRLLSDISDHTAVVVGPPPEPAVVRSLQLVGLGPRTVLAVAVLSNGAVEKRALELSRDVGEERIAAASAHLSGHLVGRPLGDVPRTALPATGDRAADDLSAAAVAAFRPVPSEDGEHVFVGGAARTAAAFDAVKTVEDILSILEEQLVVVGLLHEVLDRGQTVSIGTETGLPPLAECSLVVAPYTVEGQRSGTIGILGPTRMNYPQALAAVAIVSQRLGRRLTEG